MFDPFAEKALDAHSAAMLRARPKPLTSAPAPQIGQRRSLLGVRNTKLVRTPAASKDLRKLFDT
jgi:hypothetical protein